MRRELFIVGHARRISIDVVLLLFITPRSRRRSCAGTARHEHPALSTVVVSLHNLLGVQALQVLEGVDRQQYRSSGGVDLVVSVSLAEAVHHGRFVEMSQTDEIVRIRTRRGCIAVIIAALPMINVGHDHGPIPNVRGGHRYGRPIVFALLIFNVQLYLEIVGAVASPLTGRNGLGCNRKGVLGR